MPSEPQTESGRALYREVRSVEWGDEMRRGILAIEQEAASKAVAEFASPELLAAARRHAATDTRWKSGDCSMCVLAALIASERER